MKNLIIPFCSMKGGQGKSTLCATFATFLVEQSIPVVVLDADIQSSVYRHRQRDKEKMPDFQNWPWQVEPLPTNDVEKVKRIMERLKTIPGCVLIDCPGNVSDPALKYVYHAADIAVMPIRYDSDSMDATMLFRKVFLKVSSAKIFYVPNNIVEAQERRQQTTAERNDARKLLELPEKPDFMADREYMTPRIKQSVTVRCYNTYTGLGYYQNLAVANAFKPIVEYIKSKGNG